MPSTLLLKVQLKTYIFKHNTYYIAKDLHTPDCHTHMLSEPPITLSTRFWSVAVGICVHSGTKALVRSVTDVKKGGLEYSHLVLTRGRGQGS